MTVRTLVTCDTCGAEDDTAQYRLTLECTRGMNNGTRLAYDLCGLCASKVREALREGGK